MKKLLIRGGLAFVLLVIAGVVVLYFYRNSLIRKAVETQATDSLGVPTTVGGANLGLFGGTLSLTDLNIASPQGYDAKQMFSLGELGLGVKYGDLTGNPIKVKQITLTKPKVVLEYANGKFNFQALSDRMSGGGSGSTASQPAPAQSEQGKKLIIEQIDINEAVVVIVAKEFFKDEKPITLKNIQIKNIGNADGSQNGAAIKDVVSAVISSLAANASNEGLLKQFGNLDKILAEQASAVSGRVSKELQSQVSNMSNQLSGQLNKTLGDVGKNIPGGGDLNKVIPGGGDVGKKLEDVTKDPLKQLGGLGEKKDKDKEKKK